jgi:hypothetical protein
MANSATLSNSRAEYPLPSELADSLHICLCPCACACSAPKPVSSYTVRTRQQRAFLAGSCCPTYTAATVTRNSGGSGYSSTAPSILQVVGGTPVDKPMLIRVTGVSGGAITPTGFAVMYNAAYTTPPTNPVSTTTLSGGGAGATFNITWTKNCEPANLYRH